MFGSSLVLTVPAGLTEGIYCESCGGGTLLEDGEVGTVPWVLPADAPDAPDDALPANCTICPVHGPRMHLEARVKHAACRLSAESLRFSCER